jgi:hypothetical protein
MPSDYKNFCIPSLIKVKHSTFWSNIYDWSKISVGDLVQFPIGVSSIYNIIFNALDSS